MFISHTQAKHYGRWLTDKITNATVAVIGGYHGGNLGDMALAESITQMLSLENIKYTLQTIYNLDKWTKMPFAIVGGGAVGYADSLSRIVKRYKGDYSRVGLLGVDYNETNYPEDCLDLVRGAAFVSGRSKEQADHLMKITGRKDVYYHPDIAFSLLNDFCETQRTAIEKRDGKKLLVNVIPLYAKIENGSIRPVENYKLERPELYKDFEQMHQSYKTVIRSIVENAVDDGYEVETIPFTPQDVDFGQIILQGLPVRHAPYHSNPIRMLKKIATAELVVATRFHATIFALKTGVKLTPIAYATKNEFMLQEFGVERSAFLSTSDLANGNDQVPKPIKVHIDKVRNAEILSTNAIRKCINMLLIE